MVARRDNSLGSFLRSRRERLDPAEAGLQPGTRRRTPGLRREEVAGRAQLSVEWYTRLEQGRGGTPSAQVLDSVADALLLTRAEREHAYLLAHRLRPDSPHTDATVLDTRLQQVLDGFAYGPAYIRTAAWDVVAWNRAAQVVLSDYESMPVEDRNILKILFLDPAARAVLSNWEDQAGRTVASFRLETTRWDAPDRPESLVKELRERSADFERMWNAHNVGTLSAGVKRMTHPHVGELSLRYSSFAVDDEPGLGLVLYTAETDADLIRIKRLLDG